MGQAKQIEALEAQLAAAAAAEKERAEQEKLESARKAKMEAQCKADAVEAERREKERRSTQQKAEESQRQAAAQAAEVRQAERALHQQRADAEAAARQRERERDMKQKLEQEKAADEAQRRERAALRRDKLAEENSKAKQTQSVCQDAGSANQHAAATSSITITYIEFCQETLSSLGYRPSRDEFDAVSKFLAVSTDLMDRAPQDLPASSNMSRSDSVVEAQVRSMQHSREIRDQMHKLFEQMDANHDRTLSLEEASSVVGSSFAAHMISTMHADRSSAGLSQDNWRDYFVKCSRAAQLTDSLDEYLQLTAGFLKVLNARVRQSRQPSEANKHALQNVSKVVTAQNDEYTDLFAPLSNSTLHK